MSILVKEIGTILNQKHITSQKNTENLDMSHLNRSKVIYAIE